MLARRALQMGGWGPLGGDGETVSVPTWARYVLAAALVGAALAARLAMIPFDGGFPFVTFYPAVIVSALLFGTGPAVLAVVLSALLADYILIPVYWSFALDRAAIVPFTTYLLSGGLICLITHQLQLAKRALRARNDSLRSNVQAQLEITNALRVTEQRLRTIANNVPAMIGYWDSELRCGFANAEYRSSFGVTPEQIATMRLPDLLGAPLFKLNEPYVQGVLAGQAQRFERALLKRDGTWGYTDARYIPEFGDDGKVKGFFVLVADITALHESYERIRELARRLDTVREEERRSIVHVLHEGIAQDLFAARLTVQRLEARPDDREGLATGVKTLVELIDHCLRATRQVAASLRPSALTHLGLVPALSDHARYFGALSGLQIRVSADKPLPALDDTTALLFFRAAQEALTNVVKHAHATAAKIVVRVEHDGITMDVSDDGVGLPEGALDKPGAVGLLGIREQFTARGGSFNARRNAGRGTTVSVHLSVPG